MGSEAGMPGQVQLPRTGQRPGIGGPRDDDAAAVRRAADLVPADLWEQLTGQRRSAGAGQGKAGAGRTSGAPGTAGGWPGPAPSSPGPVSPSGAPARGSANWDEATGVAQAEARRVQADRVDLLAQRQEQLAQRQSGAAELQATQRDHVRQREAEAAARAAALEVARRAGAADLARRAAEAQAAREAGLGARARSLASAPRRDMTPRPLARDATAVALPGARRGRGVGGAQRATAPEESGGAPKAAEGARDRLGLSAADDVRRAIILSEVLGRPRSVEEGEGGEG